MPKTAPSSHVVTRSQSSKKKTLGTQTHTDIFTCPHGESVPSTATIMNDDQICSNADRRLLVQLTNQCHSIKFAVRLPTQLANRKKD